MSEKASIGVFICHCGGNISDVVDVNRVKEKVGIWDQVKIAETFEYLCSNPGQEMIKKAVKEKDLKRVIVASCSPRMHINTFRQVMKRVGLNPYLLEMVNIREQCSWVHEDKEKATNKTIDLIRAAVRRAEYLEPLIPEKLKVNENVLVIGGGIAGIYSSLELADKGYQVYLVEQNPSIGGHMAQLSKTFPTFDCSACILTPKMVSLFHHPNIKILTNSKPILVKGSSGRFDVTLKMKPRYVDLARCKACEECAVVCPVDKPSSFEENLSEEKAIHIPFKQAIPYASVIDKDYCLYITDYLAILGSPGKRGVCGKCEKNCKSDAIYFEQKNRFIDLLSKEFSAKHQGLICDFSPCYPRHSSPNFFNRSDQCLFSTALKKLHCSFNFGPHGTFGEMAVSPVLGGLLRCQGTEKFLPVFTIV